MTHGLDAGGGGGDPAADRLAGGGLCRDDRWNLLTSMIAISCWCRWWQGTLLNRLFPRRGLSGSAQACPLVAIVLVILIVGGIVGGAKAQIGAARGGERCCWRPSCCTPAVSDWVHVSWRAY